MGIFRDGMEMEIGAIILVITVNITSHLLSPAIKVLKGETQNHIYLFFQSSIQITPSLFGLFFFLDELFL